MSRHFSTAHVPPAVRLRTRHAAAAGFEVTRPAATAAADTPESADCGPCLVASLGVELSDGRRPGVAGATADAIHERADALGVDAVLLVPDPESVADGADPDEANDLTAAVERALREAASDLTVTRSPAGPYVAVTVETKAHPHADECRWIRPDDRHRSVEDRRVYTADGPVGEADDDWPGSVETYLEHAADGENMGPALAPLQSAGLAGVTNHDGVTRVDWTPPGAVVRDILTTALADRFRAAGASPVATAPATRGRRTVDPTRLLGTLDAAADGALPIRRYEATTAGADGRGGWTRPQMVTVTAAGDDGRTSFASAVELAVEACAELGVGDVVVTGLAADAPVDREWAAELAGTLALPVVAERRPAASRGPPLEASVYATTGLRRPVALGAVRLETSGEGVPASVGGDEQAWVVTVEPVGSVEAAVAACLARRERAPLPTWLAPTQVRLVPTGATHEPEGIEVATRLRDAGLRADVDDREETVAARLDRAARVPFVAVVGDREASGAPLKVRGPDGDETRMTVGELEARVAAASEGYPRPRAVLPVWLSERAPQVGTDGDSER